MRISKRERRDYLKRLKKDPNTTTAEYNRVKAELAQVAKDQHEAHTREMEENDAIRRMRNGRDKKSKTNLDIDLSVDLAVDDFTPDDL